MLTTIVSSFVASVNAENANDEYAKSRTPVQTDDLIKKLPTALLDNLHRDLMEQEEKNNKNIDSIAGISRSKLEAEIMQRRSEDRSKTVGTRRIEPELLPGALLKYIAEHGVSYEGCNPQDATNEIRNRSEFADDFPRMLTTQIQAEDIKTQQEKAGEEFAERETAEDLHDTVEKIKETAEQGKDPSLVKQAEYVKQQAETKSDTANDVLKNIAEGESVETPPHGYDEKIQNERSSEEIKEANDAVEERKVIDNKQNKKGFFSEVWDGIKQRFNNWFNGTVDQNKSGSNTTIATDEQQVTQAVTEAINENQ